MVRVLVAVSLTGLILGISNPSFGQAPPAKTADTTPVKQPVVADSSDDRLPADSFISVETQPVMIYQSNPTYPKVDKEAGATGKVWVKVLINRQGLVRKAVVLRLEPGATEAMGKSAVEAAMQNRFQPAKVKGKPVACWVTYAISFVFADKKPADSSSTKGTEKPAPKK